ncbi:CobW family GTP-binding protein [Catonella massiliensis]|uniref:GTP-binding protein n=1 Tax=Catonella massiliensis TaxID=2799636 RepID=A0ABS1IWN2_9FIRM|nr:CobW family GTP-binding protein [Catonella massiliensis]MBK5896304.1 GTP-binding protein [Catonella massiliensis]
MTKIDIISGFLGAGKTTLIKKLIKEALGGEKVVLIENEFGEIGIDGGFLKEAGIEITEMNSGCICCTLVGDFGAALRDVITKYSPDRIIIEPSGVGKLSDVIKAVADVKKDFEDVELNSFITVADAGKTTMYMKNFGEFFNDQIENANTIVLSRTSKTPESKLEKAVAAIKEHNDKAVIITTDWDSLTGKQILDTMEKAAGEIKDLLFTKEELESCEHHHHEDGHECCHGHHHEQTHEDGHECCHGHHHEHEHEDDHECCHGHHHDHEHEDDHECCHGHHHDHEHEDGHECGCGHHHEQTHEDGHECGCGHHHHHHHADEVFDSWGITTPKRFTKEALEKILDKLAWGNGLGIILRAKGIVQSEGEGWLEFDLTPGEFEVRNGAPDVTGKLCVIGSRLKKDDIKALFEV